MLPARLFSGFWFLIHKIVKQLYGEVDKIEGKDDIADKVPALVDAPESDQAAVPDGKRKQFFSMTLEQQRKGYKIKAESGMAAYKSTIAVALIGKDKGGREFQGPTELFDMRWPCPAPDIFTD